MVKFFTLNTGALFETTIDEFKVGVEYLLFGWLD